jgi:hypothetical protein
MTLVEAIGILEDDYQNHHNIQDPIPAIAIKLGIEALKGIQSCTFTELLPGETKE